MSLVAEQVGFAYPGCAPVLEGVSLEVAPGERVALCAPSGRGKTTLCRVLAGYLRPDAGRVLADGAPVAPARGARPVQLLWQHPEQAFDPRMRLGEGIAEGLAGEGAGGRSRGTVRGSGRASGRGGNADGEARVAALREALGVRDAWLSRLPHELSGGELMRCAMVRALAARPRYLVADESTAMLDAVTQAELWGVLLDLQAREGLGLVLVSHSPDLVQRLATRTVDL